MSPYGTIQGDGGRRTKSSSTRARQSQIHSQILRTLSRKTLAYDDFECECPFPLKSGAALTSTVIMTLACPSGIINEYGFLEARLKWSRNLNSVHTRPSMGRWSRSQQPHPLPPPPPPTVATRAGADITRLLPVMERPSGAVGDWVRKRHQRNHFPKL